MTAFPSFYGFTEMVCKDILQLIRQGAPSKNFMRAKQYWFPFEDWYSLFVTILKKKQTVIELATHAFKRFPYRQTNE